MASGVHEVQQRGRRARASLGLSGWRAPRAPSFSSPPCSPWRASFLPSRFRSSVFPETNFPRVIIAIDNGVMPVEQMEVTITQPIENAVNSVPGLETVRSTTSRGSAEVSLFFDWNVNMVTIAATGGCGAGHGAAKSAAHRAHQHQPAHFRHLPHPRLQPYLRYGSADAALANCHLRPEAAAQSRLWRE